MLFVCLLLLATALESLADFKRDAKSPYYIKSKTAHALFRKMLLPYNRKKFGSPHPPISDDPCMLQPLAVSVRDLPNLRVIDPPLIEINMCVGSCIYPDTIWNNSTTNGLLRALHRLENYEKYKEFPKLCCIPREYESINVTKINKNNEKVNVVYKQAKAISCACE